MAARAMFAGLVVAALAGQARARVEVRASYTVTAGVTDNALSAPDDPPPGLRAAEGDVFVSTGPTLSLRWTTPRRADELSYRFTAHLYGDHPEATSYTHRLAWTGAFSLTPRAELTGNASVAMGRLTIYDLATTGSGEPRPPGFEGFVTASGRTQLAWQPRPRVRLEQVTTLALRSGTDEGTTTPTTMELAAALTGERLDPLGARGVTVRVTGAGSWPPAAAELAEEQRRARVGLEGRYRRELDPTWSCELRAGGEEMIAEASLGGTSGPYLSAAGVLRKVHEDGVVELAVQRQVRTDLYYGSAYVAEEAALRGTSPPRWLPAGVGLTLRTSFTRVHGIGDAAARPVTQVLAAAAALGWRVSDVIQLELSYELHRQAAEDAGDPAAALLGYTRHAAMASMTVTYPAQDRGGGPRRAPLRIEGTGQPLSSPR